MPVLQFGIPSAMSVHSSNPSSNRGDCEGCVKLRREGHRHAREAKYCPRHQCKHIDASGEMCTIRKKAAETRCPTHTQCKVRSCHDQRALDMRGVLIEFCVTHKCIVIDCDEGKVHDPARGVYDNLCANHLASICKTQACMEWKSEGRNFCFQHTCVVENCNRETLSEGGRPFCVEHNKCNVTGCDKPRCQFGNRFEHVCRDHYVAPCILESCKNKASPSTRYCNLHSCRYSDRKRCEKEARPGRGKPFCTDHKCSDHDCQTLRSFSEVDGSLDMNAFCPNHECKQKDCVKHNVPDKPFCNSHCCTNQGCTRARDGDTRFGTLCYDHHEERVRTQAVDERLAERLAEIRLREEQKTRAQAADEARRQAERLAEIRLREEQKTRAQAADEARRQAERLAEIRLREEQETRAQAADEAQRQAQREERLRRQAAADAARRPEPRRPARSPPRRPYGQEGLRPGQRQAFNEYEDEGYRSHRSSGGSFHTEDGW